MTCSSQPSAPPMGGISILHGAAKYLNLEGECLGKRREEMAGLA